MGYFQLNRRTTDDVTCIVEAHANARGDLSPHSIRDPNQITTDTLGVAARIQDRRIFMPVVDLHRRVWWWIKYHRIGTSTLTEFLNAHLLQIGRTAKHHWQQGRCWFGAEHRTLKSKSRKHAESAAVIDVRVRTHHRVQSAEVERGWNFVALLLGHRPLKQTKVDEYASVLRLY
jgi:hypothetical protein